MPVAKLSVLGASWPDGAPIDKEYHSALREIFEEG